MFKLKVVLTILLLTIFISACGTGGGSKVLSPNSQKEEQRKEQTDEIYIGLDQVPEEVIKWAEDNKIESKVSKTTIGHLDAYLISLGEKPTAGYEIKVDQAGLDGGANWIIDLSIEEPIPGEMLAQVITYPYEVLAVPTSTPVKLRLWNQKGDYQELIAGQNLILKESSTKTTSRTVRPDGEYFLYPEPDPIFLALPQPMVTGGSVVEVIEIQGEWVHLRFGENQGWLPRWYLEGAKEVPVRDKVLDYMVLKEKNQGYLYPKGPAIVELAKGKLLKPLKEWDDWYFVGIIVYDIPAVQCAWIPKEALLPIGEIEPIEGFLHKGAIIYGFDSFEKNGPTNAEKLQYTMNVFVLKEKDGYIAVQSNGGWTAWTKKENLKFKYD